MVRWLSLILVLIIMPLGGCREKEKKLYAEGERALSQNRFSEAYRTFQKIAQEGGTSSYAARSLLQLAQMDRVVYRDPQKAIAHCKRLIQGNYPEEQKIKAQLLMADILAKEMKNPKAGLKILKSMAPNPLSSGLREERMVEYAIKAGDLKEASQLAQSFLQRGFKHKDKRLYLVMADLLRSAGAWKDAEAIYRRIMEEGNGEETQEALWGLANLKEDQGKLREALALLEKLRNQGYKTRLVEIQLRELKRRIREERR